MKKILLFFFVILYTHILSAKEQTIVYVDFDKVVSESKPGSVLIKQLDDIYSKTLENFEIVETNLKEKESTIISQKNILSDEKYRNMVKELRNDINNYKQERNKKSAEFQNIKIRNTNEFLKLINPIISEYSQEKSISIILQKKNIVVGKKELDITEIIIKLVNENIKEFSIKWKITI